MKNYYHLMGLGLIIMLSACSNKSYLPSSGQVGTSPYGARIILKTEDRGMLTGELIAVEGKMLYFVNERTLQCDTIKKDSVQTYQVQFARQRIKGWFIPFATLAGASFGYNSFFMVPINLFSSIALVSMSKRASRYNESDIIWRDLHQFARYPQGLPEGMRTVDVIPAGEAQ